RGEARERLARRGHQVQRCHGWLRPGRSAGVETAIVPDGPAPVHSASIAEPGLAQASRGRFGYDSHLSVILRESTGESDCGSLGRKAGELRCLIRGRLNCKPGPEECILSVNYSLVLQCSGGSNHRGDGNESLLDVLRYIATELPGSYRLVY